jgi:carbon storage regulator
VLVLTRQKDEQVVVGNQVLIQVIEIRGDKVRLGIDAPRSVSVHRAEVQEAINDNLRQMGTQVKPVVTLLTKPPVEAAGHQLIDRLRTRNARLLAFLKRVRRELKQQLFVSQSLANSLKTRAEQSEAALLRIIDHVTTHGSIDKDHLLLSDILVAKRDQQGQPNG